MSDAATQDDAQRPVEVIDDVAASRFEAHVDGELAGLLAYRRRPHGIVFTHAEVRREFEGRGIASRLTRAALDAAVAEHVTITPLCPFVMGYIRRHQEYVEHVDPAHQESVRAS